MIPPPPTPWQHLTAEECLDALWQRVEALPEPQRSELRAGLQAVGEHLHQALSDLEEIEVDLD